MALKILFCILFFILIFKKTLGRNKLGSVPAEIQPEDDTLGVPKVDKFPEKETRAGSTKENIDLSLLKCKLNMELSTYIYVSCDNFAGNQSSLG